MSSRPLRQFCLLLTLIAALALAGAAGAQTEAEPASSALSVAEIAFAADYDREERVAIEVADSFAADVGKVVCYTRITGATAETQITHAWYHEGEVRAKVVLNVASKNWRTYSTKNIQPGWTGAWEVQVLDEDGVLLDRASFTVE